MLKIPRDGFSLRSLLLLLLLVAILASVISPVSAQDLGLETGDDSSNESTRVLNRRSKIVLPNVQDEAANGNDDRESGIKKNAVVALSEEGGLGIFDAFFASLSMIIVSEIGDETFIIAALMAMRHPKSIVLSGALTALTVMTVLSTGLGRIVPNLISRKHTNSAATDNCHD